MENRLEAHFENRTYYFFITDKKAGEFSIEMYKAPYTFVRKNDVWDNHPGNKQNMVPALMQIVATAAGY